MPRPRRDEPGRRPRWELTYGDMMSLLLVFFVFVCSQDPEPPREVEENVAFAEEEHPRETASLPRDVGMLPERSGIGAPLLACIFFERGKDDLPESARDELHRLAPALLSSTLPLVIAGYVSPFVDRGSGESPGDADRRAFARAMAVVKFLAGEDAAAPGATPGVESGAASGAKSGEPRLLPASGGLHGGPFPSHATGSSDGRDRVDIYPIAKEKGR